MAQIRRTRRASLAAILLGIGLGGFADGILFHQILQWHNLVSNWIPPTATETMRINMRWDGIFHAFVWLVTLIGIFLLWRAAYQGQPIPSLRHFAGQLLLGWGSFNLVEGIIDHQILAIHYVRQVPEYMIYNLTFLAAGGVLVILIGWLMMRRAEF